MNINKGVQQRGILSPFLFKLYLDKVLGDISDINKGCRLGIMRMNILAYADDLVLISDNKEILEILYNKLEDEMHNLRLLIDKTKSKCMIFERSTNRSLLKELKLRNEALEVVDSYKYLGHVIQNQLSDILDVKQLLNDFNGRINNVIRNFKNVSIETLLYLFDVFCLLDYGLSLWDLGTIFNKQIFKIFKTFFSNALKRILGVPLGSSVHATAEICNMCHHVALTQARYMKRMISSRNTIIHLCMPFLKLGYVCTSLEKIFKEKYSNYVWSNELDILRSRLTWVQGHEERRALHDLYGV